MKTKNRLQNSTYNLEKCKTIDSKQNYMWNKPKSMTLF